MNILMWNGTKLPVTGSSEVSGKWVSEDFKNLCT